MHAANAGTHATTDAASDGASDTASDAASDAATTDAGSNTSAGVLSHHEKLPHSADTASPSCFGENDQRWRIHGSPA